MKNKKEVKKKKGNIFVKKMNGDSEEYNPEKLKNSLKRVGADNKEIQEILKKVEKILYNGIETKKLFDIVHKELDKEKPYSGLKYNLKKSMLDMRIHGGFVFEKFIGRVLEKQGYEIKMNPVIQGKNVTHEIDVSAKKTGEKEKVMVEVKHHMKSGIIESIQTALYVYARFLEVEKYFTKPMLVTNTKFSNQVIKYSKGVGIRLMGWKYPSEDSLEKNIEKYKLYPITILKLSTSQKRRYLEQEILTIQEIKDQKNLSKKIKEQIRSILESKEI